MSGQPDTDTSFAWQAIGDILASGFAAEAKREQERLAAEAQYQSALELSRQVGARLGIGANEAFNALTYIPDDMLGLLASPQGWRALSVYIAGSLSLPSPNFAPSVH